MTARTLAAPALKITEAPPLAHMLRKIVSQLMGRLQSTAKAERVLALEERVALGPKKSLVLVRCHGQRFLVAVSGDTIGPLIEVARPKADRRGSTTSASPVGQVREA